ncbi:hypothetical protein [Achromobacter kerstersii]|uniref:DUF2188 domain-containing protein n=1 Tax=Achromobacter kerstersii TaxID=1353890 RepID=A0A6S6ZWW7_9BURK|nr:hypothetical protein [Achromobacter kerstersii]CAB3698701.1 hypothetical protein LMG3441_02429 [Achromobacter kerstersii]
MMIEVFQLTDGHWSFRRIALLGVEEDAGHYPTRDEAVTAASLKYPGESVSTVEATTDPATGKLRSD